MGWLCHLMFRCNINIFVRPEVIILKSLGIFGREIIGRKWSQSKICSIYKKGLRRRRSSLKLAHQPYHIGACRVLRFHSDTRLEDFCVRNGFQCLDKHKFLWVFMVTMLQHTNAILQSTPTLPYTPTLCSCGGETAVVDQ